MSSLKGIKYTHTHILPVHTKTDPVSELDVHCFSLLYSKWLQYWTSLKWCTCFFFAWLFLLSLTDRRVEPQFCMASYLRYRADLLHCISKYGQRPLLEILRLLGRDLFMPEKLKRDFYGCHQNHSFMRINRMFGFLLPGWWLLCLWPLSPNQYQP